MRKYDVKVGEIDEEEMFSKGEKDAIVSVEKKTTLGEGSNADSHNSSSEGLPLESSERLSVNALASPKDVAKIAKDTEVIKRALKKIINEGGLNEEINTPAQRNNQTSNIITILKDRNTILFQTQDKLFR